MQMPNLLFWEGKAKAHLRASRVRACPLRPAARLRPRLPGAPSPARPGSSRASAWAPRSESLGNGAGSADPRPGKPARTQQRRRGAREGRTDRLPAGLQTPTRAPPLQGPLPPAARGAAAQVPPQARTPPPAPPSSPAGAHRVGAPRRGPRAPWPPVLAPSPCAGHEEPRGAARRRRGPGCAHTSPAAHGDMSGARGLQRPAASPSPRRPAGRRCPGE
ncbi:translation initiation factor IF-2-like [Vulpes lagopus]|uniref:translation initiation factor IF-2-like n=1 Tax=Vulpes lagopus TaxID=494514 RepID=UPI001BC914AF|nr:translation initiation factor IF-2-like [Vulpes lagopus]